MKTFELPELTDYEQFEEKELLQESQNEFINKNEIQSFTYDVDKSSTDWVVTFNQWSKIRHHTSRGYVPYMDYNCAAGDQSIVKPNQWLEGMVNGRWSRLSDADHR